MSIKLLNGCVSTHPRECGFAAELYKDVTSISRNGSGRSRTLDREAHLEAMDPEKRKIAARQKAWREANKEQIAAQQKAWRDAHPDYYRQRKKLAQSTAQ